MDDSRVISFCLYSNKNPLKGIFDTNPDIGILEYCRHVVEDVISDNNYKQKDTVAYLKRRSCNHRVCILLQNFVNNVVCAVMATLDDYLFVPREHFIELPLSNTLDNLEQDVMTPEELEEHDKMVENEDFDDENSDIED